jgi:hypothetical protein
LSLKPATSGELVAWMVYDARIVMAMPPEMGASRPVSRMPLMCASSALGLPSRLNA